MNKNILLGLMLLAYLIPIVFIYLNYSKKNHSLSNLLGDKKCNSIIFYSMLVMGYFTLLYEIERNNIVSFILIFLLIIGIIGVLSVYEDKKIHYLFASLVLFSILGFMYNHCYLTNCNKLHLSLYIQVILMIIIIINIKANIFYSEIFFLINFAVYYLYLHYLDNHK